MLDVGFCERSRTWRGLRVCLSVCLGWSESLVLSDIETMLRYILAVFLQSIFQLLSYIGLSQISQKPSTFQRLYIVFLSYSLLSLLLLVINALMAYKWTLQQRAESKVINVGEWSLMDATSHLIQQTGQWELRLDQTLTLFSLGLLFAFEFH